MTTTVFEKIGLSGNEAGVYQALLRTGPASIRQIASETGINRGTVYESLKKLRERGLVSRSDKKQRQNFIAEDPEVFLTYFRDERKRLATLRKELGRALPELKAMYAGPKHQPVIRMFEGQAGVRFILEDLLKTMGQEEKKEYYAYSAADIREYLYFHFKSFSERRIKAGIKTKVIALGSGGELRGLDERRWLTTKRGAPTYILIYANRVALISLSSGGKPAAVLMEDRALADTQRLIFERLWESLPR
ncbi:MAG: ArsR family transcriptional regulator [Candidatus Liptonbacteria bacterium]|nr:ArsR family transcriptional regulator [Candidatus Liptonbacteria bacterium]